MKIAENDVNNNFTVLRLLLALLVVFGHFHLLAGVYAPPWPFNYASASVDCFFVVSGYLITNSFDRDPDFKRYYLRRFFRIYPLYLAVVVAQTIAMGILSTGGFGANFVDLLKYFAANAVFANFLGHDIGEGVLRNLTDPSLNASLWTLKIEFAFYLILPFLWLLVRRFGVGVLVAVFFASVAYMEVLKHYDLYRYAKQLPGQMQFFVLGIAAYQFRHKLVMDRWIALGLAVVFAVILTSLLKTKMPVVYPLVTAAFVVLAALKAPALKIKTDVSYGVYLLHAPIIQLALLTGLYRPDWIGLGAVVLLTVVLAVIAERAIEAPGITIGKRLAKGARKPTDDGPSGGRGRSPVTPLQPDPFMGGKPAPTGVFTSAHALTAVVLNDFCHVQGGASKVAIDEAVSLAHAGLNVIFVGAVGPVCKELQEAPLKVVCLGQKELLDVGKSPSVVLQGLWNSEAGRRVEALLKPLDRDHTIVHLHGYTKALTVSPVKAARRMGFSVVCTLHDFFSACPNGAFFDYRRQQPCTRRALSLGCVAANCDKRRYTHKMFRVARGLIQQWFGGFPNVIEHYVSLSQRSASILAPYLPSRAKVHPLHNAIDWPRPQRVSAGDNRTIVCVGRLDQEKGVLLLARAAAELGLKVVFVGDGPLRRNIETDAGMPVTGWISRDEVRKHVAEARCLVFPSMWYETYGLVVAEAAAYGVPVIVSDITAAAERVEEGRTGWIFRSGDAADLVRCLQLLEDDALVGAVGAQAYKTFWASAATNATHARDLTRIYQSILADCAA